MNDSRTLQTIVTTMEARHGVIGRVWIGDRGMASAANLAWLREGTRRYIIGAPKAELKKFCQRTGQRHRLARAARGHRGEAHVLSGDPGHDHPVPLDRASQQRTRDA